MGRGQQDKNLIKHNVTRDEMEEPFYNNPRKLRKVGGFYYLYGQTDAGRRLFEVFIMKGHTARVISARDMDKEERNIYER